MTDHAPLVMGVFLVIVLGVLGALVVASENKAFAASSPLSVSVAGTTVTYSCPTCSTGASGVTSLNSIAGALHIQNNDSTLSFNTGFSHITVSLNLANPNTWTATQTFQNILTSADDAYNIGSSSNHFATTYTDTVEAAGHDLKLIERTNTLNIDFQQGNTVMGWFDNNGNLNLNYNEYFDGTASPSSGAGIGENGVGALVLIGNGLNFKVGSNVGVAGFIAGELQPWSDDAQTLGDSSTGWANVFTHAFGIMSNPTYFSYSSTQVFGLSSTGIQNTQGFQTFSCSISGGSTSTVCNLAVTEPDTSYYAMCTGTGSGLIGDGISTAATSDTQITLSYAAAGVLGGAANCLVVHH